jgi:Sporulation and spore germination
MSRRLALALVAAAVVIAVAGLAAIWWPRSSEIAPGAPAPAGTAPLAADEVPEIVTLYFPGSGWKLEEEEREIAPGSGPEEKVRRIVRELIAGPRKEGLYAPLPSEVEVQGAYVGARGIAYVDLHRPENGPPPAAGSLQEQLMVYSLVNSVVVNVEGVDQVVLLWNGNQPPSVAGHLDNQRPLASNLGLVATSP